MRGIDALKIIRENPPDLVVLDMMLPGLDGSYVLERARKEGFAAPVIIVSARAEQEDKIQGLRIGADDYVTKTVRLGRVARRASVLASVAATGAESTPSVRSRSISKLGSFAGAERRSI